MTFCARFTGTGRVLQAPETRSQVTRYHFISGLPRSGSTLLAAILNQNPAFRAGMSSPLFAIFNAALSAMGGSNEYAIFLNEEQKSRILRGIFDGYFGTEAPDRIFMDTNRMWTARVPVLRKLFPDARIVCCVRNPAWVLDSLETLIRKNALDTSRIFGNDAERMTVFSRADALMDKSRLIGSSYLALKEAYYAHEARALLLLDYDTFVTHPRDAMNLVYQFLGEPAFVHDFENVSYQAEEFDSQLLARGLHQVSGRVQRRDRPTVLPPDLFKRFAALEFWGKGNSLAHHIAVTR